MLIIYSLLNLRKLDPHEYYDEVDLNTSVLHRKPGKIRA
jgi:hypothetical protein